MHTVSDLEAFSDASVCSDELQVETAKPVISMRRNVYRFSECFVRIPAGFGAAGYFNRAIA